MYIPKYFKLYELLPPAEYIDEETGWERFDERLLRTLDAVREIVGVPLTCNSWKNGGSRRLSGWRPQYCAIGSPKSQHKLGRAADLVSSRISAQNMRELLEANKDRLPYDVRVEKGVNWLHIDVKDMGVKIYQFGA